MKFTFQFKENSEISGQQEKACMSCENLSRKQKTKAMSNGNLFMWNLLKNLRLTTNTFQLKAKKILELLASCQKRIKRNKRISNIMIMVNKTMIRKTKKRCLNMAQKILKPAMKTLKIQVILIIFMDKKKMININVMIRTVNQKQINLIWFSFLQNLQELTGFGLN